MKRQKKVVENLELLEQVWEEYQIYGKDEIDYIENTRSPRSVFRASP